MIVLLIYLHRENCYEEDGCDIGFDGSDTSDVCWMVSFGIDRSVYLHGCYYLGFDT